MVYLNPRLFWANVIVGSLLILALFEQAVEYRNNGYIACAQFGHIVACWDRDATD